MSERMVPFLSRKHRPDTSFPKGLKKACEFSLDSEGLA